MAMTIQQIFAPVTPTQVRTNLVLTLVKMGIPANQWAPGGVASSMLTVCAAFLSMMTGQLQNIIQSFFLPTAVALAIQTGNTGLLSLLAQYVYGVTVPQATFASGPCTLVNGGGGIYVVAAGTMTALDPTTGNTFTNPTGFTLGALATLTVTLQCTIAGTKGNAAPGNISQILTAPLSSAPVTVTNPSALVGIDPPSATAIQALCLGALGASSVRGVRSAYAYSILTAVNAVTGLPVNVNRFTISASSHTGTVAIAICGPDGTTDPNDLAGVILAIEGLQNAPFGGARPDAVTATVVAATPVPYTRTITPYVLAPTGTTGAQLQAAINLALEAYMSNPQSNPIGGATAADDTNGTFTGIFATGVYGAVAAGVQSVAGCSLISARGAVPDLALSGIEVATNSITIAAPVITNPIGG